MSQIEAKNLTRKFTVTKKKQGFLDGIKSFIKPEKKEIIAVNDISFSIEEGELLGFIGPNGAGKTTTLKMLTGLIHPTSGTAQVLGYMPFDRKHLFLKQIALVMGQKAQLWSDISAMDIFLLNKDIYAIETKQFESTVQELSEMLEVKDCLDVQVRKLSLGQRMKCELMLSLLHRPKVLFLDEPTIGLDFQSQKRIRVFLKDYNKLYKSTIMLTSHYMDDVEQVCDRIVVINKGRLVYDGGIKEVSKRFMEEKNLVIDFNCEISRNDLEGYGKITEISQTRAILSVPKEKHTKVAAAILEKFDVDNLDIKGVDLEDVIQSMYEKK